MVQPSSKGLKARSLAHSAYLIWVYWFMGTVLQLHEYMDTHGYKVHGYRAHGYKHGTGYMGTLEHDKWVGGNMVCEYMGTWL